jgi:hypothetical protein
MRNERRTRSESGMKANLALFAAGVAAFMVAFAWRHSSCAQEAMQALAALSADNATAAAALSNAEARWVVAEKERANLLSTLDSLSKTPTGKTTAPGKKAGFDPAVALAERNRLDGERQKDPRVQLRQLAAERAKLVTRYGALYWKLKLAPEQIGQFEAIVARRYEQVQDMMAAVLAQGVSVSSPDFSKLYSPLQQKIDETFRAAQKELLGEAGYQQFDEYERGLPARNVVRSMAGAAVLVGTPFSPQQAEQLVGIVADASNAYRQGRNVSPLEIDWEQADTRAREILSSEQMIAFQTLAPWTGGTGRAWLQFNRVLNEAQIADRKHSAAATMPTGGE